MDERLRFVARLLDGEKMAPLCAEFGISPKTGYKIYHRYKGCGVEGLTDRSRRPQRYANQLPDTIEKLIVRLKREYPTWGAPKIRERLRRRPACRWSSGPTTACLRLTARPLWPQPPVGLVVAPDAPDTQPGPHPVFRTLRPPCRNHPVVSPDRVYVFHNRLTHSLKVAQIARTIAEMFASKAACAALGGIEADAAEAAALAHDLGHPPFGHLAEEELEGLVRRAGVPDGFGCTPAPNVAPRRPVQIASGH